ncbi:S-layer homology domain-containing protein, partial [Bacillus sp. JJ722]|uniref:S-layer homology domain-containing protein n=1 Tax=Bacillus sp. JJ722 TaxID=3122973 RepID=UPI0030003135
AYQPKSYRKFVATAATATLVAGAIAPLASAASFTDVAPKYKEAVDFVVSKGVQGLTETQFGVAENIKRVDAAVMLVKVLGLDTEKAPASGFTDVPARAAKEVNALKAAGITSGKSATQFGANDLITRGELAVWIQKGFELKGTSEVTFTDVSDRYKEAVSALVDNKVTSGINETQFGTNNNAKRGDFAIFLKRANDAVNPLATVTVEEIKAVDSTTLTLKLKGEVKEVKATDFKFDNGLEVKEAKIVEAPKAAEDTFTYVQLKTSTHQAGTKYTLTELFGTKVAADKAPSFDVAATPVVESVKAINNKQIEVKFNAPVGKVDISNFTRNVDSNGQAVITGGTVQLSDDKQTVTVNLATPAKQQEKVEVTVKGIKDEKGVEFKEAKHSIVFFDNAAPTVGEVKAIGSKDLEINFSEPMKTAPTAKVTIDKSIYQPTVVLDATGTKGTVTLPVELTEGKHKIELAGGTDYSSTTGYAIEKVEKEFTFVKDTTALTATVKTSTENSVTLKFNKPLKTDLKDLINRNIAVFSHTYKGQNTKLTEVKQITNDEYKLTFAQPFAPGSTTLYFDYAANTADANKVKDGYGNILQPANWTVSTVADFTKPEVASVAQQDSNTIRLAFTETVNPTTATAVSNYTLKNAEGKAVVINSVNVVQDTDGKVVDIKTSDLKDGGNYTLEVKNVKDNSLNGNVIDTVTKTISINDKFAPTVTETATVVSSAKIKINFSEAMDRASIENVKMYDVPEKVKITATADNKAVILDYTEYNAANTAKAVDFTSATNTNNPTSINVGRVKDAAGNETTKFVTAVTVAATTPHVAVEKAELTALDTIKVTLNDVVSVTGTPTVKVTVNSVEQDAVVQSTTGVDGKSILTLKLAADKKVAETNTEALNISVKTVGQVDAIVNADGAKLNIATPVVVKDAIGPVALKRETVDADKDSKLDEIKVTFSEAVYAGSVAKEDFVVDGYVVKGIKSVTNDTTNPETSSVVVVELEEKSVQDITALPTVTVGEVTDLLGNKSVAETTGIKTTTGFPVVTFGGTTYVYDGSFSVNAKLPATSTAAADKYRFQATVTKDGKAVSGLVINYKEGTVDKSFTTDANGVAMFGPETGLPSAAVDALKLADGVTTPFTVQLDAGAYELKLALVDKDTKTPVSEATFTYNN